jgi:hypothetical protein
MNMPAFALGFISGLIIQFLVNLFIKRWNTRIRKREFINKHKAF